MAKISKRDILRELKKEDKTNVTFRITKGLIERFKASCDKDGVSNSAVVERLLKEYLGET